MGPSETAQAYLNLLGIEIEAWPPPQIPERAPWPQSSYHEPSVKMGEAMIQARMNMKYWAAYVKDTPHIAKNLFCVDEAQWIAEAKNLRQRADKFKKEHPGQMVFPQPAYLTAQEVMARRRSSRYSKMWSKDGWLKTEARVAAHLSTKE